MNIPIIRLEVEHMKHTMCAALSEHAALMDSSVKSAIDAYCTEDNLNSVVSIAVREALNSAVKEEVRNFFRYSGNGRTAIREAVIQFLDDVYPITTTKEQ